MHAKRLRILFWLFCNQKDMKITWQMKNNMTMTWQIKKDMTAFSSLYNTQVIRNVLTGRPPQVADRLSKPTQSTSRQSEFSSHSHESRKSRRKRSSRIVVLTRSFLNCTWPVRATSPDWNNYSDGAHSRLRDWRLAAMMGAQLETLSETPLT